MPSTSLDQPNHLRIGFSHVASVRSRPWLDVPNLWRQIVSKQGQKDFSGWSVGREGGVWAVRLGGTLITESTSHHHRKSYCLQYWNTALETHRTRETHSTINTTLITAGNWLLWELLEPHWNNSDENYSKNVLENFEHFRGIIKVCERMCKLQIVFLVISDFWMEH